MLELAGRAGCVSIEAGVESLTEEGRSALEKKCRLSTSELTDRLIYAKKFVPFVQGNLIEMEQDDAEAVEAWRKRLQGEGVWANKPVPLFPYPGSPDYTKRWGEPDERAWERFEVHAWPTIFLIDGQGVIRAVYVGDDHAPEIERDLARLLGR